jgi:glycosyltransferase involved in cell wall biosynthesis
MQQKPAVSIVIPVRDALDTLIETLLSISHQSVSPEEIIIVDDGSRDPVETVLGDSAVSIIRLPESLGPAAARNIGVQSARQDIVLFIDADVILSPDAIERIVCTMAHKPDIAAIQGIYSPDLPPDRNLCTRYQNHYYYYVFNSIKTASPALCATFCFAVRRAVFLKMGGFDTDILKPTVEDEIFGYALEAAGYGILLDKKLRVTHLARYEFDTLILRKFRMSFNQIKSLLRGIKPPVSTLSSKNKTHHPFDTIAAVALSPLLFLTALLRIPACLLALLVYTAANARFWRYLFRVEAPAFAMEMLGLTWIDQISIFCGLSAGAFDYLILRNKY